jgi:Rrf2 family transcriptional regulator, cysteine metabolism repressor
MGDSSAERIRISLKAEYALAAIFDLALQPPGEPIKIAGIAKRQRIPQKFLELILAGLKQGGFVESRRGAEGGYLLGRSPETITVGEVIRFVEGSRGRHSARRSGDNPFVAMWRKVDESFSAIVDHTTFAELARAWQERQSRYMPNWEI